jgi:hypothetical protein
VLPDIAPMLADRGIPLSLDGWSAEPKLDGWRARVLADDGQVRLRTRSGRDISSSVRSIGHLADRRLVLDGELVADAGRMEDFYRVGPALARRWQVSFVAFDVLWLDANSSPDAPSLSGVASSTNSAYRCRWSRRSPTTRRLSYSRRAASSASKASSSSSSPLPTALACVRLAGGR